MDRIAVIQLVVLLLSVPLQFLVVKYLSNNSVQRNYALTKLMRSAVGFRDKYLSWQYWEQWCVDLLAHTQLYSGTTRGQSNAPPGQSPAIEVIKYTDPDGYFANSPDPRSPRAPHVKYRVGQVIRHRKFGYRGIIVGWDEKGRAPESWFKQMHTDKHWRDLPNYSVLVDTRDRAVAQHTYVVEENIEIISNTKVIHPEVDTYFEHYDGAQYLPRPWLRTIYPHD